MGKKFKAGWRKSETRNRRTMTHDYASRATDLPVLFSFLAFTILHSHNETWCWRFAS